MSLQTSLDRLRAIEYEFADEGCERYRIAPPAKDAQRAAVHAHLGSLPADLDALLQLTSGLGGWGIYFDLTSRLMPPFRLSTTPTLQLSEYLEGWYLEAGAEECRTWWFGTDPYDVILGPSLEGWLDRLASYAESLRDAEAGADEPKEPQKPERRALAVARAAFLDKEQDHDVLAWARALPELRWFFDLRDAEAMTEASREAIDVPGCLIAPVSFRRYGRVVAAALSADYQGLRTAPTERAVLGPADSRASAHAVANPIRDTWERIERWAARWAPETLAELNRPASGPSVAEVERLVSPSMPEDYLASLAVHDGAWRRGPFSERLLPLEEVASNWQSMVDIAKDPPIPHDRIRAGHGVRPVWWSPGWIPVFSDESGALSCIDVDAYGGGAVGQIVRVDARHSDDRRIVASSFADLLAQELRRLECGELVAVEWGGVFFRVMAREVLARHDWEHLRVRGQPHPPYKTQTPEVQAAQIVERLVQEGLRFRDERAGKPGDMAAYTAVRALANVLRFSELEENDASTAVEALRFVTENPTLTSMDLMVRVRRVRRKG